MIVVDVETTGLDPKKHSICSIGAVEFENPENNKFYQECRIWGGAKISKETLEINGFTEASLRDPAKPTLERTLRRFHLWTEAIKDRTIAGENPSFDRDFITAGFARYDIPSIIIDEPARDDIPDILGHRTVDMHSISYAHHIKRGVEIPLKNGRTRINADYTLRYAGLPEEPKPHNALTGAKMEAEALSRLILGKGLLREFAQHPIPPYLLL